MAGIIVELIISWLLLWLVCKKHLAVLGFTPTKHRVINWCIGFLIAAFCYTLYQLMSTAFANNSWVINKQVTAKTIWEGSRWTLISVLYEELIFRGALLYIAINKIGVLKACILSAVCFGIYHWFSYNVFGNPFMMIITFCMTAIVGLSWAFAFAKTGSVYLPTGLHLGWNLFSIVVFSNGNLAQAILVKANGNQLQGVLSWLVFLFQVLTLPVLTFWYLKQFSNKQAVPVDKELIPISTQNRNP